VTQAAGSKEAAEVPPLQPLAETPILTSMDRRAIRSTRRMLDTLARSDGAEEDQLVL
jgi:hypothetical protein